MVDGQELLCCGMAVKGCGVSFITSQLIWRASWVAAIARKKLQPNGFSQVISLLEPKVTTHHHLIHWTKSRISLCVTTYILALSCIYPAEDRAKFPTKSRKCVGNVDLSFRFPTIRKYYFSPSDLSLAFLSVYTA